MGDGHEFELVAAIDFGTTYSGYAYSYWCEKDKVHVNANWSSGSAMWKVPTAILFDSNRKFYAFGEEAEIKYSEFAESEDEHKYYYFHRFKMVLYNQTKITRDMDLVGANGKVMKAIDVFSGAIEYLKNHLLSSINDRNAGNKVSVEKVHWILTVPAIWNDSAKQFMREAAVKAKIPSKCLTIGLEPECASLYIQTLAEERLHTAHINKVGAKCMVLDNGGGTIDVTVHTLLDVGVKELYPATGGAWGGTLVDQAFEDYLTAMLSRTVVERIKKEYPVDWLSIMRDFESIKKRIKRENNNDPVLIVLRPCVKEIYESVNDIDFNQAFQNPQQCSRGALLRGKNRLQIPRNVVTEMITTVAQKVKIHVSNLLQQHDLKDLDFIAMAGGFSNSPILVDEIRSVAGSIPVIVPEDAELAVVKGAVIFGRRPNAIRSRRSKRSYGISIISGFRDGVDPERLKFIDDDGAVKCKMKFHTLVSVNQDIDIGEKVCKIYQPIYHNQTEVYIELYAAENEAEYCDEISVMKVGSLVVPMSNTSGDKSRKVVVEVEFGCTEINVNGRDETSGAIVNASYDFLA